MLQESSHDTPCSVFPAIVAMTQWASVSLSIIISLLLFFWKKCIGCTDALAYWAVWKHLWEAHALMQNLAAELGVEEKKQLCKASLVFRTRQPTWNAPSVPHCSQELQWVRIKILWITAIRRHWKGDKSAFYLHFSFHLMPIQAAATFLFF